MSAHKTTFRGHRIAAIAVVPVALAAAAFATPETSASPREPASAYQEPLVPDDWPDEGSGYPGYADQPSPTGTVSNHGSGLDATSVALGALGGIALGGAGLGITLASDAATTRRCRQHDSAHRPDGPCGYLGTARRRILARWTPTDESPGHTE
jgi:hypothetical protein